DLLTLARADAGERPVTREALYLDDVASDAVAAVRALAERQGVALEVGQFEEAGIAGDPALVRRLLVIVLDNAIKYTPAGGRVRLDVATTDGARSAVVTDTGIGIPADQLPHVFDRFYRGDPARRAARASRWAGPIPSPHSARCGRRAPCPIRQCRAVTRRTHPITTRSATCRWMCHGCGRRASARPKRPGTPHAINSPSTAPPSSST